MTPQVRAGSQEVLAPRHGEIRWPERGRDPEPWLEVPSGAAVGRRAQRMPSFEVQAGQAPQPWAAWVFLAMSICCERQARFAVGEY